MIKVTPEGRDGIWLPDKDSLIDFLLEYKDDQIHNFIPSSMVIMGADWSKESVIDYVRKSERLAILTGDSMRHNMNHALAAISDNKLYMFDIGDVSDLLIE